MSASTAGANAGAGTDLILTALPPAVAASTAPQTTILAAAAAAQQVQIQVPAGGKGKMNSTGAAGGMCDEKTVEYLRDLIEEKKNIEVNSSNKSSDGSENTTKKIVLRLLDQGKDMLKVTSLFKTTTKIRRKLVKICQKT